MKLKASCTGAQGSNMKLKASWTGAKGSNMKLKASCTGAKAANMKLKASCTGVKAANMKLEASWTGVNMKLEASLRFFSQGHGKSFWAANRSKVDFPIAKKENLPPRLLAAAATKPPQLSSWYVQDLLKLS